MGLRVSRRIVREEWDVERSEARTMRAVGGRAGW